MRKGCFGGLMHMIATACFRLGAALASTLISTVAFLALSVLAPLLLGATREALLRVIGVSRHRDATHSGMRVSSPAAYALLSGMAWSLAYGLLHGMWTLARRLSDSPSDQCDAALALFAWGPALLIAALFLLIGSGVCLLAHRYEQR